jgi:hypothetical protein
VTLLVLGAMALEVSFTSMQQTPERNDVGCRCIPYLTPEQCPHRITAPTAQNVEAADGNGRRGKEREFTGVRRRLRVEVVPFGRYAQRILDDDPRDRADGDRRVSNVAETGVRP